MHFIVFDLEATCWTEDSPLLQQEIIEIGAYAMDRFGEVQSHFQSFIKPVIHPFLSPFCKKLTSIEQSDVDGARTFDRVYRDWIDWAEQYADGDIRFCSWGHMDYELIKDDCHHHRLEMAWDSSFFDVKKAYNRLKGVQGKPYGLKTALKREQLELEGTHHRALSAVADSYLLNENIENIQS